ncbi:MAG: hydantoinase B/oxoprolinase family protein [Puniceicoccaceae bacterium]
MVGRAAVQLSNIWRFAADTGGTFTDCIAVAPDASEHRLKVLSNGALRATFQGWRDSRTLQMQSSWKAVPGFCRGFELWCDDDRLGSIADDDCEKGWLQLEIDGATPRLEPGAVLELRSPWEAPVLAARLLTGTCGNDPMPPLEMRLGTTRGTNALLENKGAKVAFFVSEGFADLCRIGDQRRPDLFALNIVKAQPLHHGVIEVPGRHALDGKIIQPYDWHCETVLAGIEAAKAAGCTAAAVVLLHSYRFPEMEEMLVDHLRRLGCFTYVAGSAEIRPFIHYLRRAETTLVDATLGPLMRDYLDAVERGLDSAQLRIMTSAGELLSRANFRPVDSLLSGPAGGVIGAVRVGRRAGLERIIALDMGGTSTDVSRWNGDFAYQSEQRVGAARILARSVKIETVAAGGGSICRVEQDRVRVGPESAGAMPGPACYGCGGPLTVTDVNLLLGRLDPDGFQIPISLKEAEWASLKLRGKPEDDAWLAGLLQLANERMAQAIRQISVRDGYDPANFALVAFGGAGGMHACELADMLGMQTVLSPCDAGLLSAAGLQASEVSCTRERSLLCSMESWSQREESLLNEMRAEAFQFLQSEGMRDLSGLKEQIEFDVRLVGQESTLTVKADCSLEDAFIRKFGEIFGYEPPQPVRLELVVVRMRWGTADILDSLENFSPVNPSSASVPTPVRTLQSWFHGSRLLTPVFLREHLEVGVVVEGPALVTDAFSVLVIPPGWRGIKGDRGSLRLERFQATTFVSQREISAPESVTREILLHRFNGLVQEMGEQLRRTAFSTNIRERLDYSCALLDAEGLLLVNAPHIPVHLGALGTCVRRVLEVIPLRPGDVIVTNHPAFGGSHLPDVTVISGVFHNGRRVAILANRAHHAEIGGIQPGSMPPRARSLAQEGVVIEPQYLVEGGSPRFAVLEHLLRSAAWPSRAIAENLADLQSQIAANHRGAMLLKALIEQEGVDQVMHFLAAAAEIAEQASVRALKRMGNRKFHATDRLDDGTVLELRGHVEGGRLLLDFTGCAAMHPGNLNATPAIVSSAVLYVMRLFLSEELPLNEGMLRPVEMVLPRCFLNPEFPADPALCPAVVGGNVETSQRVVDLLLLAFGQVAQGQGTMNNVLFGDDRFGYYETIGGGAGAGKGFPGASGVHVHMTNTAITDPEILEHRYPLRIWRFALRHGSGGIGRWNGGDGLVREYEFLRTMQVSLLCQRRTCEPQGREGGGAGVCGNQLRIRTDGSMDPREGLDGWQAEPGERLRMETPGGGAWGSISPLCKNGMDLRD